MGLLLSVVVAARQAARAEAARLGLTSFRFYPVDYRPCGGEEDQGGEDRRRLPYRKAYNLSRWRT